MALDGPDGPRGRPVEPVDGPGVPGEAGGEGRVVGRLGDVVLLVAEGGLVGVLDAIGGIARHDFDVGFLDLGEFLAAAICEHGGAGARGARHAGEHSQREELVRRHGLELGGALEVREAHRPHGEVRPGRGVLVTVFGNVDVAGRVDHEDARVAAETHAAAAAVVPGLNVPRIGPVVVLEVVAGGRCQGAEGEVVDEGWHAGVFLQVAKVEEEVTAQVSRNSSICEVAITRCL